MSEPLYVSESQIAKIAGVHRRASLPDGTVAEFGVHGPIKSLFKLDAEPDHPLPVDFVVAAAGG